MNGWHKRLIAFICVIAVLSFFLAPYTTPVRAADGGATVQITDFKVLTLDGKETKAPLMAGSSYVVTFTLQIAKDVVTDTITLRTDLDQVNPSTPFWVLPDYKGITPNVNPNRNQIAFNGAPGGNLAFTLKGKVPDNFNSQLATDSAKTFKVTGVKEPDGISGVVFDDGKTFVNALPTGKLVHLKRSITLLTLGSGSGTIKDAKPIDAQDKSMETYATTFTQKKDAIEGQDLDPFLVKMVGGVVAQAQALAASGYTDEASALLQTLPDKGWPQAGASNTMLYAAIGVLALLAVLLGFLMLKAKGAASYSRGVVEDQVKRLDVVSVKAGRLGDKVLVQEINAVKDELDRVSR